MSVPASSTHGGDGARRLREAGDAVLAVVEQELAGWVQRQVARILDAWGRLDAVDRSRAEADARDAGRRAAERVGAELRALFALAPRSQTATPLEIVRSAYREPTEVLVAAGVAAVERDGFDERAWPDDRYGLVPRSLSDLCAAPDDDDVAAIGALQLAWGLAKVAALREAGDGAADGPQR